MMHHDKHLYYFEKYLRNEMPEEERAAFDEKLAEDPALREAFGRYKANRDAELEELIEEHRIERNDTRLNKLIFLLISLTGIALTVNYYFYKAPAKNNTGTQHKTPKPLYTYIPFVNWEKRAEKNAPKKTEPAKDTLARQNVIPEEDEVEVIEPPLSDQDRTDNDIFLTDTFISVYDKAYIQSLIAAKRSVTEPDSLPAPLRSKNEKNQQLFVEFWQSPVKYRGYLFNGRKLIVYGIDAPYEVYIFRDDEALQMIHPYGETQLLPQANFRAF